MIKSIAETKMVKFIKPTVGFFTRGKIMPSDVDAVIDVLDDINIFTQSYRISRDGFGEGVMYIGVKGL